MRADVRVMPVALVQGDAAEDGRDERCTSTRRRRARRARLPAPNASSPTSSDTVNPIPPSRPTAPTSAQPRPGASAARVNRATSQVAPRMPSGLPTTSPRATPCATGSANVVCTVPRLRVTPAANTANTGTATPADSGRHRCSHRSASDSWQGVEPQRPPGGLRRRRDDEPEGDAGDRRVDAGRVHGGPRGHAEGDQQPPADPARRIRSAKTTTVAAPMPSQSAETDSV